jgi:hypothetical protein
MGPQQVLSAAAAVVVAIAGAASAAPWSGKKAKELGDSIAVIDLGPGDVRTQIGAALVGNSLDVLTGDGVEDALAGIDVDRDALELAAALADAQSKFGALACKEATAAAQSAIALGAARQAAGMKVPELPRAWAYVLLCADRTGDATGAVVAATQLRALGSSPDVDASVLARYPEVDALSNREAIEIEINAEVAGADVWVDFKRAGKAPMKIVLTAGSHVIAAASGTRRGVLTGTVVRKQPVVTVPMPDQAGAWAHLAKRVASWGGKLPAASDLEAVMNEVGARIAIVRHGDTIEAWGHVGKSEKLRRLGDGDDGVRPLGEANELAALVADRVETWNSRAPDPDQPLLVETPEERRRYGKGGEKDKDEDTPWWVYASIGGAILVGATIIYVKESADNTQRVELKYPGLRW